MKFYGESFLAILGILVILVIMSSIAVSFAVFLYMSMMILVIDYAADVLAIWGMQAKGGILMMTNKFIEENFTIGGVTCTQYTKMID